MHRTTTTVANLALREIGTYRIESFEEDSADAEIVRDLWEDTLRSCLSRHEWRFAMKQVELQQGDSPVARFAYSYPLPADYIRMSSACERSDANDPIMDFEIVHNTSFPNPVMLTDAKSVFLDYVALIEDPNYWSPWFVDFFVVTLASKLAAPLKSTTEKQRLEELVDVKLRHARSVDSTMQSPRRPPVGNWVRSMKIRGRWP